MTGLVRAAVFCATLALGLVSAQAADKAFKRDDLADSAIKLEAQIKSEAGPVAKTNATLKSDADAAFKRFDFRTGLKVLYTSGYTENAIVHHGRLDPGVLLLAKPYRKADLARMIRMALSAADGRG